MVFLAHIWPKKRQQKLFVAQQNADKTGLSYKEVTDKMANTCQCFCGDVL